MMAFRISPHSSELPRAGGGPARGRQSSGWAGPPQLGLRREGGGVHRREREVHPVQPPPASGWLRRLLGGVVFAVGRFVFLGDVSD